MCSLAQNYKTAKVMAPLTGHGMMRREGPLCGCGQQRCEGGQARAVLS